MSQYSFKLAQSEEIDAYFQLREEIFCREQGLFKGSDRDEVDGIAYAIVAIATDKNDKQVVGIVRIYETAPGIWYGGRLGVRQDYRRVGRLGKGLIVKAVTTAHGWGCRQFLATVQPQNVPLFRRLHWSSLEERTICDRPHHLMKADLNYYPPDTQLRPALPALLVSC